MTPEKQCAVCGQSFVPYKQGEECCSPTCRTMLKVKLSDEERKKSQASRKAELDAMTKPPDFDLKRHPKARVEWFMALADEYKARFNKFLTPQELEWARTMAMRRLSEEKFYSGFYVKNGKIIESKIDRESDDNDHDTNGNDDGDETD